MLKIMPSLSHSEIRNGLTNIVVFSAAIIVLVALLGSLLRIKEIGFQPVMYLQIVVSLFVICLYLFRERLSLNSRSQTICACFFIAGVGGILSFGLVGAGTLLIVGGCIISSLLINIRAAVIYAMLGWAVISSQLILAALTKLEYNVQLGDYPLSAAAWLNNLIVYSYLVTISLLLIYKFSDYLGMLLAAQTEHIESQSEKIDHAETLLELVVNSLPYGIIWKDNEFRYLGANKFFLDDIHVADFSEIAGKTDFEIMPDDIAQRFHELDKEVLEKGKLVVNYEERHTNKFGQIRYISANRVRLSASDGKVLGILSAYNDITDRIEMEMDLREAKQSAEQANIAKSQFLANMSHEIRTPLNGILGLLDLSLRTKLSNQQLNYLKKADLSAKTLLNIINDVLDISKIEAGQMQMESVSFALEQILDHVKSQFSVMAQGKNIDFELTYEGPDDLWLQGDPTRLLQILMNLCANSIKFTQVGGVVVQCHAQSDKQNVSLEFTVKDSGIGIDEKVIPKLFSNFTQADSTITRKFGGTGLGLAIVKALVSLMGGSISVKSALGEGSEFSLSLLLPVGQRTKLHLDTESEADFHGKQLLLVEDNAINQMIATEILEETGARVQCAENGQVALDILSQEPFDLVLMDIQMPVMDGCAAIAQIRSAEKWKSLPVIALTANAMLHDIQKYEALGFTDHIAKPFERTHLLDVISKHLR